MTKADLLARLPVEGEDLLLRACTRQDIERLAAWPAYPFPYESFTLSFRNAERAVLDEAYRRIGLAEDRLTLVADMPDEPCVAYLALLSIDGDMHRVGNMAIRVHPESCGQGIGTRILKVVCGWAFANGVRSLRLDVAASNGRAVRCYEKSGFRVVGETWREAPDLSVADLDRPRYAFVRDASCTDRGRVLLRFAVLEASRDADSGVDRE